MSGNGSIQNLASRDEAFLRRTDKFFQEGFNLIHKDLGDYLINGIAKAYGAILLQEAGCSGLGDEDNESFVDIFQQSPCLEEILNNFGDIVANNVPKILEEHQGETIQARSLVGTHSKDSPVNFVSRDGGHKLSVVILIDGHRQLTNKAVLERRNTSINICIHSSEEVHCTLSKQRVFKDLLSSFILNTFDIVPSPVDTSKYMEESRVYVSFFQPLDPRSLLPVHFFLGEGIFPSLVAVFLLLQNGVWGVTGSHNILNLFQSGP